MPPERVVVAALTALPPERLTGMPKFTVSILNWTVPVAVLGVIVAVNATDCANAEGFTDEVNDVELDDGFTVCPPERLPVLVG